MEGRVRAQGSWKCSKIDCGEDGPSPTFADLKVRYPLDQQGSQTSLKCKETLSPCLFSWMLFFFYRYSVVHWTLYMDELYVCELYFNKAIKKKKECHLSFLLNQGKLTKRAMRKWERILIQRPHQSTFPSGSRVSQEARCQDKNKATQDLALRPCRCLWQGQWMRHETQQHPQNTHYHPSHTKCSLKIAHKPTTNTRRTRLHAFLWPAC